MAYPGRLISPHPTVLERDGTPTHWIWKDCTLNRARRNSSEAKQLAARMMVAPEKVGEMELPGTHDTHIHGPLKFSQIGSDAATKLLATALEP